MSISQTYRQTYQKYSSEPQKKKKLGKVGKRGIGLILVKTVTIVRSVSQTVAIATVLVIEINT